MRPADFWRLTPAEFWLMVEAKKPVKMYGNLTEHQVAALYEEAYGSPEED